MNTAKQSGHIGHETMAQYVTRIWKEYREASRSLKGCKSSVDWSYKMCAYRQAQKKWVLAESLAKANAITL